MATGRNQPNNPALQGEGNRSADKNYREAAKRHADNPASKRAARDAERAIESDEEDELEEAEEAGKARRQDEDN